MRWTGCRLGPLRALSGGASPRSPLFTPRIPMRLFIDLSLGRKLLGGFLLVGLTAVARRRRAGSAGIRRVSRRRSNALPQPGRTRPRNSAALVAATRRSARNSSRPARVANAGRISRRPGHAREPNDRHRFDLARARRQRSHGRGHASGVLPLHRGALAFLDASANLPALVAERSSATRRARCSRASSPRRARRSNRRSMTCRR